MTIFHLLKFPETFEEIEDAIQYYRIPNEVYEGMWEWRKANYSYHKNFAEYRIQKEKEFRRLLLEYEGPL